MFWTVYHILSERLAAAILDRARWKLRILLAGLGTVCNDVLAC